LSGPKPTLTRREALVPLRGLTRPASAARALQNGAPNIERADKVVQLIARQKGMQNAKVDAILALVAERLAANRKKAAA
jgi:hypothetical protein